MSTPGAGGRRRQQRRGWRGRWRPARAQRSGYGDAAGARCGARVAADCRCTCAFRHRSAAGRCGGCQAGQSECPASSASCIRPPDTGRLLSAVSCVQEEKLRPAKAEEVVRVYDLHLSHVKELAEVAGQVGGASGEALLDECAAKVGRAPHCWQPAVLYSFAGRASSVWRLHLHACSAFCRRRSPRRAGACMLGTHTWLRTSRARQTRCLAAHGSALRGPSSGGGSASTQMQKRWPTWRPCLSRWR
jgi:hypothetical protein